MADMTNDRRRAKEKLTLLENKEGTVLYQVLGDLIDLVEEDAMEGDSRKYTEAGKIFLIEQLKRNYRKIVAKTPKHTQQKLFKDEDRNR